MLFFYFLYSAEDARPQVLRQGSSQTQASLTREWQRFMQNQNGETKNCWLVRQLKKLFKKESRIAPIHIQSAPTTARTQRSSEEPDILVTDATMVLENTSLPQLPAVYSHNRPPLAPPHRGRIVPLPLRPQSDTSVSSPVSPITENSNRGHAEFLNLPCPLDAPSSRASIISSGGQITGQMDCPWYPGLSGSRSSLSTVTPWDPSSPFFVDESLQD